MYNQKSEHLLICQNIKVGAGFLLKLVTSGTYQKFFPLLGDCIGLSFSLFCTAFLCFIY
jgi:hypothetical protein